MIILGIIGVVASITIPQVVANYTKKVTVNKLKKNYSVIQQALRRSELENEPLQSWDFTLDGHKFFERYIKNYFANANEITTVELNKKVKSPRKRLSGLDYIGSAYNSSQATHFLINDGSLITLNLVSSSQDALWIAIDINGFAEPDTIGKDTFYFIFSSKYGLRPLGDRGTPSNWQCQDCTRSKLLGNSTAACNKQSNGYWCTYLIMNDGWEIRKDYPW